MNQQVWKEHMLPIPDGQLAWFTAGHGPTVLFLAGGPGDNHTYLRSLAEPLTAYFHCVLLDQRGTGRSLLHRMDETTLHIITFSQTSKQYAASWEKHGFGSSATPGVPRLRSSIASLIPNVWSVQR